MTDATILEGLQAIAKTHLAYDGDMVMDAPLVETLKLDSIRMLTLIVEVENRFEICLEEDDESSIETLQDLIVVVRRLTDGRR